MKLELNWVGKEYVKNFNYNAIQYNIDEDIEHNNLPDNCNSENLMFIGDNLKVLKYLQNNFKNKIKMIYIDPPYNTRTDKIYNDNFILTIDDIKLYCNVSDKEAKKILRNIDIYTKTHSAWLNFMYLRLMLAKDLLKDDGVIFISIDDKEQANLKLLCDEIFGGENFVTQLVWSTKKSAQGLHTKNLVISNHEYILIYAKNIKAFKFLGINREDKTFSNPDNDKRGLWKRQYLQRFGHNFPIRTLIDPETNISYYFETPYTQEKLDQWLKENKIIFPKNGRGYPIKKEFLNEYKYRQQVVTYLGLFSSKVATQKLYKIFNNLKIFRSPKPIDLIKFLIKITTQDNDIILDFFVGSGTTGHAIIETNIEDKSNRKFILCQIDEEIKDENIKKEFKTIADICIKRLKRVSSNYKKDIFIYNKDLGFKIFKIN